MIMSQIVENPQAFARGFSWLVTIKPTNVDYNTPNVVTAIVAPNE
jgi:hypothetical protein